MTTLALSQHCSISRHLSLSDSLSLLSARCPPPSRFFQSIFWRPSLFVSHLLSLARPASCTRLRAEVAPTPCDARIASESWVRVERFRCCSGDVCLLSLLLVMMDESDALSHCTFVSLSVAHCVRNHVFFSTLGPSARPEVNVGSAPGAARSLLCSHLPILNSLRLHRPLNLELESNSRVSLIRSGWPSSPLSLSGGLSRLLYLVAV